MRTENQRAWFFVLPVLLLVAFNALVPIMTVVNYSVQETFGNNVFFWQGLDWFEQILRSERFHAALGRQFLFTFLILIIEVPLGIIVALSMPRKGFWVPVCLVTMALPIGQPRIGESVPESTWPTGSPASFTTGVPSRAIRRPSNLK